MHKAQQGIIAIGLFLLIAVGLPTKARAAAKESDDAIVITFKDGHQQTFSLAEVARIEFKTPAAHATKNTSSVDMPGRHHFIGKWTVGDGSGHTFNFTFDENGQATNNVDQGGHGTWTYIDGEARVTWDNGWHDAIRKVGMKYRKFAYAPGTSFDDKPQNVGDAQKTNAEPL